MMKLIESLDVYSRRNDPVQVNQIEMRERKEALLGGNLGMERGDLSSEVTTSSVSHNKSRSSLLGWSAIRKVGMNMSKKHAVASENGNQSRHVIVAAAIIGPTRSAMPAAASMTEKAVVLVMDQQ